jgi:hypothetical protein
LALLAALLSLPGFLQQYGNQTLLLFGSQVPLKHIYAIFSGLLGLSIYFYALGLLGEYKIFRNLNFCGNLTYAISLVLPIILMLIIVFTPIVSYLASNINSIKNESISLVVSIVISALSSGLVEFVYKLYTETLRKKKSIAQSKADIDSLFLTQKLLKEGYFDIAITEAWKAVEKCLVGTISAVVGLEFTNNARDLIDDALKYKVITPEMQSPLKILRESRNKSVHSIKSFQQQKAANLISIAEKTINHCNGIQEECYFCNNKFRITEMETDNITGASVCKKCAKENSNWRDDLFDLSRES